MPKKQAFGMTLRKNGIRLTVKPGTVRGNDPLLLISLDLDEVDIYRYTDRRRPISDLPGTLPAFVSMIRCGEYNE
jgi:hypothetical protein